MLKIQEFCRTHPENFKELLEKEYAITSKVDEEKGLILFKYNQIKSPFKEEIVKECRGIILSLDSFEIVGRGFSKFFNYGESNASPIDWESATIREKIDGSIIKIFFHDGEWNIATNGTINAFNTDLPSPFYSEEWNTMITSFGQLFLYTMSERYHVKDWSFLGGTEEWTHIFELASPFNKVVVSYDKPTIYYLASKENMTGDEHFFFNIDTVIPVPTSYSVKSIEEALQLVETFGSDKEGLVVCDRHFNRIKIKGDVYVQLHHLRGEGAFTEKRALDIVRANEVEEVITYFPEFASTIYNVKIRYDNHIHKAKEYIKYLEGLSGVITGDRKRFANQVKSSPYKDISFKWLDGKLSSVEEYYNGMTTEKLLESIK